MLLWSKIKVYVIVLVRIDYILGYWFYVECVYIFSIIVFDMKGYY